jgi:arginyl-tRNA synthetase
MIHDAISDGLKKLGIDCDYIELEIPKFEALGDISTPVAMSLAKTLKKSPKKIAEDIITAIGSHDEFESIEIAGPGFINFRFSQKYLGEQLKRLYTEKEKFLRPTVSDGLRVQIEFVSANPTGPLHLGHGRGAALGASLYNLLSRAGYIVEREFYVNDAGRQVRLLGESVYAQYQKLHGKDYPVPEDGYQGEYASEIAQEIIDTNGWQFIDKSYKEAAEFFIDFSYKKMLLNIKSDLEIFGVTFDTWQSERELYNNGTIKQTLVDLKKMDLIYVEEGATWFRSQKFGDEKDRVIIKADGLYTYFLPDIAYHRKKADKGFDILIDIWGADHHGYIPRMNAVLEALGHKGKLKVILVQMVSLLKDGVPFQMSKRAGNFVTLSEVYDEIGVDTTRFMFLTRRSDSQLEFDLATAKKESSENPVYYIQYAYARINSILKKAGVGAYCNTPLQDINTAILNEPEEQSLIKKLITYPLVFETAARLFEPHRITFYLQELAGLFHPFYNKHRVIVEDRALSQARLLLIECVKIVLEEGLSVLGISAPDRM